MTSARKTALGLAALAVGALGASACGYPDFGFGPIGTGGSSSSATTGGGGKGGDPATTSTSSATASVTSSASGGGAGGGAGGGCPAKAPSTCVYTPGQHCGCADTDKCAVTEDATGKATCILAGNLSAWQKCNKDEDCDADNWCDELLKVCRPVCSSAIQCPDGAQCVQAKQGDGVSDVKGLFVCTPHCNPSLGGPCGQGTTCVYDNSVTDFSCVATKNYAAGTQCNVMADCAKGLVCSSYNGAAKTCKRWCTPADGTLNGTCAFSTPYCDSIGVQIMYEGMDYGACDPP